MKTLLSPITNIFSKKSGEAGTGETDQVNANTHSPKIEIGELDDEKFARSYYKIHKGVVEIKVRLDRLEAAKENITEERFKSLLENYSGFLTINVPVFNQYRKEIDHRITAALREKKVAAHRYSELKKQIDQETKLLEGGLISKKNFQKKVEPLRSETKICANAYKSLKMKIEFLKTLKDNKYVPKPESEEKNQGEAEEAPEDAAKEINEKVNDKQEEATSKIKKTVQVGREVRLNFEPGTKMDLEIQSISIPVTCQFVGADQFEFFLITRLTPYNTVKAKLLPGAFIGCNCITNGKQYQFKAKIIEHMTKPIRVVILDYPEKMNILDLRTTERLTCRIPVKIHFRGKAKDAIICDISPKGCGIEANYESNEKNYIARKDEEFELEWCFPGSSKCFKVTGIVRNCRKKQLKLIYGVQITSMVDEVQTAILRYVYMALADE
ncbi:PilZ domain-containing protein [Desulfobacter vibrioformis]|uniref:PilZ domain-containing protein n=1 Tax=Desulfobacter vibrioformis TaxID=34031 RepID=UPI000553678E|nr:PilZ domain-containing protein [Desulfobacter vibrioformis]